MVNKCTGIIVMKFKHIFLVQRSCTRRSTCGSATTTRTTICTATPPASRDSLQHHHLTTLLHPDPPIAARHRRRHRPRRSWRLCLPGRRTRCPSARPGVGASWATPVGPLSLQLVDILAAWRRQTPRWPRRRRRKGKY